MSLLFWPVYGIMRVHRKKKKKLKLRMFTLSYERHGSRVALAHFSGSFDMLLLVLDTY